jgi:hypothetical protein
MSSVAVVFYFKALCFQLHLKTGKPQEPLENKVWQLPESSSQSAVSGFVREWKHSVIVTFFWGGRDYYVKM